MKRFLLLFVITIVLTGILTACSQKKSDVKEAEVAVDADVVIEKSVFTEKAQFIPVTIDGINMEIIAVKASDDTLRTAFNTCQVCFDSGRGHYEQVGDVLVCQNCGNSFHMDQVSVDKGGCNPVGISEDMRVETEDTITIPLDLLKQAAPLFEYRSKS